MTRFGDDFIYQTVNQISIQAQTILMPDWSNKKLL